MTTTTAIRRRTTYLWPSLLLVLLLLVYLSRDSWLPPVIAAFDDGINVAFRIDQILTLAIGLVGTWWVLATVQLVVIEGIVERHRGRKLPMLVMNLVRLVVFAIAAVVIAVAVFNLSEVLVAVLGGLIAVLVALFFRDVVAELFAGLSLNLDDGIDIGRHIELLDGPRGVVQEMDWRSVCLLRDDGNLAIVPNTLLARGIFTNRDSQGHHQRVDFQLNMDYSLPVSRVVRVLRAALIEAGRHDGIRNEAQPRVAASEPGEYGIVYSLSFEFDGARISEGDARTHVLTVLMNHLQSTGLTVALPKQNVFVGEFRTMGKRWEEPSDRAFLIGEIDLFASLEPEEVRAMADAVIIHRVAGGDAIIHQGDTTTSMYGLAEGMLEVAVASDDKLLPVATISPGQFFGEMSLLADEPRSATVTALVESVVFELTRESFQPILANRAGIAESISTLIAARQLANSEALRDASREAREEAISDRSSSLLTQISRVFSLLRGEGQV